MSKSKNSIDFSTILALSAHDMKNSMALLMNAVDSILAEYTPETEEQVKQFETLQYETLRMNGELVQLLTLYRQKNELLKVRMDEHYIADILEEKVALNIQLIETSGTRVELMCDEALSAYFDQDLVGGLVQNIIMNCIRYTKDAIRILAEEKGNYIVISISDDGSGYPEDMIACPSSRAEKAQLSNGSTHLGLYFAEHIASLHEHNEYKGYIELKNGGVLGGGVFELYLPK